MYRVAMSCMQGDTGEKWGYFNGTSLEKIWGWSRRYGHGKMPDVVLYYPEKNWLFLAEVGDEPRPSGRKAVMMNLPVLFKGCKGGFGLCHSIPDTGRNGTLSERTSPGKRRCGVAEAPDLTSSILTAPGSWGHMIIKS